MSRPHDAVERQADEIAQNGRPTLRGVERPASRIATGGEPLPGDFAPIAEAQLGADLTHVRLHRDRDSMETSAWMGARAFTVGADVFLGRGEGMVDTAAGRRTLMHELAHTIQQERGGLAIQRQIMVKGEPWFELKKVRDRFGAPGVEIYLKMRDDQGYFEYPSEEALFQEIELRILAIQMFSRIETTGMADGYEASGRYTWTDACCRYPGPKEHFDLNEANWDTRSNNPPVFTLKEAVRPSVAIRSIFVPRAGTVLDCGMMIVALRYRALLESMGSTKFDSTFIGENAPVISKLHEKSVPGSVHPLLTSGYVLDEQVPYDPQDPTKHLIPGDHVYFRNHSSYRGRLWSGEQAIYIGNGMFVGFGLTQTDRSEERPMDLRDDPTGEHTGFQKYAVTHDEMIEDLRQQLGDSSISVDQIPGLRSKSDPHFIDVRRPSMPANDYFESL